MIKKPDINVLCETWFNETNIDYLPGNKAFKTVRTKKNRRWTLNFYVENIYLLKLMKCQF